MFFSIWIHRSLCMYHSSCHGWLGSGHSISSAWSIIAMSRCFLMTPEALAMIKRAATAREYADVGLICVLGGPPGFVRTYKTLPIQISQPLQRHKGRTDQNGKSSTFILAETWFWFRKWYLLHQNPPRHINGLVQERRNSIANALELRLSFTNLSIWCHLVKSNRKSL